MICTAGSLVSARKTIILWRHTSVEAVEAGCEYLKNGDHIVFLTSQPIFHVIPELLSCTFLSFSGIKIWRNMTPETFDEYFKLIACCQER